MKLTNKTILVTGASKGIGSATAEAFAAEGANIIVHYHTNKAKAEELVHKLKEMSVKATSVSADIASPQEVTKMFEQIHKSFNGLDVVINNAGVFDEKDNPNNLEAFHRIFATNFFGQIDVTRQARKIMSTGKIIFISSAHAKLGNGRPSAIAYSSSKAALESYIKNLAKDAAPDILVNAVAPGRTLTPMWGDMTDSKKAKLAADHLTNRWIDPSEIAQAVVFLAKNDSVCGEVLVVDGGMSLKTLG